MLLLESGRLSRCGEGLKRGPDVFMARVGKMNSHGRNRNGRKVPRAVGSDDG